VGHRARRVRELSRLQQLRDVRPHGARLPRGCGRCCGPPVPLLWPHGAHGTQLPRCASSSGEPLDNNTVQYPQLSLRQTLLYSCCPFRQYSAVNSGSTVQYSTRLCCPSKATLKVGEHLEIPVVVLTSLGGSVTASMQALGSPMTASTQAMDCQLSLTFCAPPFFAPPCLWQSVADGAQPYGHGRLPVCRRGWILRWSVSTAACRATSSRECPSPVLCNTCGGRGHIAAECPSDARALRGRR